MEFCVFALQPAHSRHWLKPVFDGELSSVAPCGRRLFNCRRGQAPTLPLSSHFRLTSRQSPAMPKFSVGQEPDPPGYYPPIAVRHSLFAIRHSLSFWLSRSLALPFFLRPTLPSYFAPCSLSRVPCPISFAQFVGLTSSHKTRKPTKGASVSHHLLLGTMGSDACQSGDGSSRAPG